MMFLYGWKTSLRNGKNFTEKLIKMRVFIFLDYDGTIVSFKPKPEQAKPTKKVFRTIKKLSSKENFVVSIISGRSHRELNSFFPFKRLILVSNHGIQIKFSQKNKFFFEKAKKTVSLIKKIDSASKKKFSKIKGILFQNKKYAFVIHYRNVSEKKHSKIKSDFRKLVKKIDSKKQLEVIKGAKVLEAKPKGWNKGNAVKKILKEKQRKQKDLIFYFGDDFSDEDAFKALKNDFTFLVGKKRKTNAKFFVENTAETIKFLNSIADAFL